MKDVSIDVLNSCHSTVKPWSSLNAHTHYYGLLGIKSFTIYNKLKNILGITCSNWSEIIWIPLQKSNSAFSCKKLGISVKDPKTLQIIEKVFCLTLLCRLLRLNHSQTLSISWSTQELLLATFPSWVISFLFNEPGRCEFIHDNTCWRWCERGCPFDVEDIPIVVPNSCHSFVKPWSSSITGTRHYARLQTQIQLERFKQLEKRLSITCSNSLANFELHCNNSIRHFN